MKISAVLFVLAELPPLLIFKGKTNGSKEKTLQNNINVKRGIILVKYQDNASTEYPYLFVGLIIYD